MAKNQKPRKQYVPPDKERDAVVVAYRKGALAVLRSVRSGTVDETELDKLQNFMQTSLAMMELVPLATFREAQRIAEMRSLIHHAPEEQVVMDPRKLAQTVNTGEGNG